MNIQYIRFFETSHSKSRGRQSVFDSIQNNLTWLPTGVGWMGSILWTPAILTSNNRWILIYMDSFQFAFQQYVNTIFYGLLPVNNFPSELLPARTFRPSVPLSYLRTRCVLSFSSSLDHQDITCNRRAGTGSVLSLWKLLGWGWSTPYQFRHLVCRSSRVKIFSFQGFR